MDEQLNGAPRALAQLWFAGRGHGGGARSLGRAASRRLLARACGDRARPHSLSHSGAHAAVIVGAAGSRVGIDIEYTCERDVRRLAGFAFAPEELPQLDSLAAAEARQRFYLLWTLKEAFAKALGIGLLAALRSCRFAAQDGRWQVAVPCAEPWQAAVFRPRPAIMLAAVVIGAGPDAGAGWACQEWPADAAGWRPVLALAGGQAAATRAARNCAAARPRSTRAPRH